MSTTMTQPSETRITTHRSPSPLSGVNEDSYNERFPSFDNSGPYFNQANVTESPVETQSAHSVVPEYKWPARKASQRLRDGRQHGHQPRRSVSDALNRLRTRQGSVSENTKELAQALKAPVSYRLIALCTAWYLTSALTNTSSKTILNAFPRPATLTVLQFASVSGWCLLSASLASIFPSLKRSIPALRNGLRKPSWDVIATAMPLSVFQLLGHLLSSYATSKIPVSMVHTIKGLSPLFTVLAYRVVLRIRYKRATYLSLIPLTVGVMLACSRGFSTNFWGISASLVAALVFVAQNIFSKKLFTESSKAEAEGHIQQTRKLDKLNLLCYCSVGALIFSGPVWLYTEGFSIMEDFWKDGAVDLTQKKGTMDHGQLALEYIFNGIFHFLQNIIAFILLSMMSPVSYSVASLIKRVAVIGFAIIWFGSETNSVQVFGIGLTMVGLYLYDRTSTEDAAERKTKVDHFRNQNPLLPVTEMDEKARENGHLAGPRPSMNETWRFPGPESKRGDSPTLTGEKNGWLAPGTKQESTWGPGDGR